RGCKGWAGRAAPAASGHPHRRRLAREYPRRRAVYRGVLRGNGAVPLYNLMEDAATAEISRTQVWQWLHHGAQLADGRAVTADMVRKTIPEQLAHIRSQIGEGRFNAGKFEQAAQLFEQMMTSSDCKEFLTLEAYKYLD